MFHGGYPIAGNWEGLPGLYERHQSNANVFHQVIFAFLRVWSLRSVAVVSGLALSSGVTAVLSQLPLHTLPKHQRYSICPIPWYPVGTASGKLWIFGSFDVVTLFWTIEHANSHSKTSMQRFARHRLRQAYNSARLSKNRVSTSELQHA